MFWKQDGIDFKYLKEYSYRDILGAVMGDKKIVVVQLSGGNDYLNCIIPYTNSEYLDNRPNVRITEEKVLPIGGGLGMNPSMAPIKELFDDGKVAIIHGTGYPDPNRSHFRSMDIWHTAEPETVLNEGWLGKASRAIDPKGENALTSINFGRGLPRALASHGVPVASVGNLETYGLFPDVDNGQEKDRILSAFSQMYAGTDGKTAVLDFLGQTGTDALKGADILRTAPALYSSSVEYASNSIAQSMKSIAQVMFADLGTRIYYTQHGGFDTHQGELITHSNLWKEVAGAVGDFMDDLKEHSREDEVIILIFSEFGRRIKDNGSGTDHGSGGGAFVIGKNVHGGMYGQYPALAEVDQLEGDLLFNNDFRSTYSTILEQWLKIDPKPIVHGTFEQFSFV